jgi:hypothetical protein
MRNLVVVLYLDLCVCVFVCVCERERGALLRAGFLVHESLSLEGTIAYYLRVTTVASSFREIALQTFLKILN